MSTARLLLALGILALATGPATATAKPLTRKHAERLVVAKVHHKYAALTSVTADCKKLTARRFDCEYTADPEEAYEDCQFQNAMYGITDPCPFWQGADATVRRYKFGTSVKVKAPKPIYL